jgi:hypothetical protein
MMAVEFRRGVGSAVASPASIACATTGGAFGAGRDPRWQDRETPTSISDEDNAGGRVASMTMRFMALNGAPEDSANPGGDGHRKRAPERNPERWSKDFGPSRLRPQPS